MELGIIELIIGLAGKYPIVASIFMVVGVLRAVFKPLFTFLHVVADATPSAKDNELLLKVEGGKVYKAIAWFMDYIASIKLPGQK